MKIDLYGTMSENNVYINTLLFKDKSGVLYNIDRELTSWDYDKESKEFGMTWHGCYIWDSDKYDEDAYYLNDNNVKDVDFINSLTFVEAEIEDDAPEDYSVTIDKIETDECIIYERR